MIVTGILILVIAIVLVNCSDFGSWSYNPIVGTTGFILFLIGIFTIMCGIYGADFNDIIDGFNRVINYLKTH